jgi:hypothetical protein
VYVHDISALLSQDTNLRNMDGADLQAYGGCSLLLNIQQIEYKLLPRDDLARLSTSAGRYQMGHAVHPAVQSTLLTDDFWRDLFVLSARTEISPKSTTLAHTPQAQRQLRLAYISRNDATSKENYCSALDASALTISVTPS